MGELLIGLSGAIYFSVTFAFPVRKDVSRKSQLGTGLALMACFGAALGFTLFSSPIATSFSALCAAGKFLGLLGAIKTTATALARRPS